ncbi:TetR/AcrR family transcriptional regulator [Desulfovibrio sp. OttesenSCG-928-O18]|nr:TetR/AcrR family transcriptional regulator [Desulfovibrio sp. OttesenSCG-928-O18]
MTTGARIREAALRRFAAQGYAATSLAEIASDCGIRKSSIYTYFGSKQEMFLSLVKQSAHAELAYATGLVLRKGSVPESLAGLLKALPDRFRDSACFRFWIQTIYLPPLVVAAEVREYEKIYSAGLGAALQAALEKGLDAPEAKRAFLARAYLGILKGLYADLLLGNNDDTESMAETMWGMYLCALTF